MLRTALKPRWVATLILALAVSTIFVFLSQWQFSRSTQNVDIPEVTTEVPKPLTEVLLPGEPITTTNADQIVMLSGRFDPARQVVVTDRVLDDVEGYWVVTAFIVDGAPEREGALTTPEIAIPVARGWVESPEQADAPPAGPVQLTGRLLPSESPVLQRDLPAGQAAALSAADLTNLWQIDTYRGFVVSFAEAGPQGSELGAHAEAGDLKGISVGPQPAGQTFNWLNIFYAIEWVIFAGFAVFLWWRLVADDYQRQQEALEDLAEWEENQKRQAQEQEEASI
ncbi:SURF1 family protein [Acaricomes phytoseiuli]|uniref:SURF1 family protein n=1 Tax=Acaricomes phytoseiuli TaxID=291968 RepID=UPI0003653978|nr:SURF1 family protein [Acaricomes phytoseiuli]MCW1250099.1 SURF1 family protein [Acaricomes phytoseiuli]